ncbi:MAG: MarR family winged helix-turn-helix transcriptional regulator [Stackebrandtia sp.]
MDEPATHPAADIAAAWKRELPGVPTESIAVVTPLWRLAKLLADDRRRVLARAGVDAATVDLLNTLRRSGAPYTLSTRQLGQRTLVTAGAISQRVARAEREGLVRRRRPDEGGRTVLVELTDAGHALAESTVEKMLSRESELLSGLAPGRRDELASLLDVLLDDVRRRLQS